MITQEGPKTHYDLLIYKQKAILESSISFQNSQQEK